MDKKKIWEVILNSVKKMTVDEYNKQYDKILLEEKMEELKTKMVQNLIERQVSPHIKPENFELFQKAIKGIKTKEDAFWSGYNIAVRDARMEIACHLIDLDPNGNKEKLFKKIDKYIANTQFEGLT